MYIHKCMSIITVVKYWGDVTNYFSGFEKWFQFVCELCIISMSVNTCVRVSPMAYVLTISSSSSSPPPYFFI